MTAVYASLIRRPGMSWIIGIPAKRCEKLFMRNADNRCTKAAIDGRFCMAHMTAYNRL